MVTVNPVLKCHIHNFLNTSGMVGECPALPQIQCLKTFSVKKFSPVFFNIQSKPPLELLDAVLCLPLSILGMWDSLWVARIICLKLGFTAPLCSKQLQTHHLHLSIITTFNNQVPTPGLTNTTGMRPWENPGAHEKAGIAHTWMCLDWKRRGIIPSEKHCREMELLGLSSEQGWTKGFLST